MRRFVSALLSAALIAAPAAAPAQKAGAKGAGEPIAPKLEALAASGNAEAAYHLGMLRQLGRDGVKKDEKAAFELFQRAAGAGDPLAAYKLGDYYEGQPNGVVETDEALALQHKLKAAEAGYALAQHDVAQIFYERGDTASALRWLEAAARQGHVPSLQALSSLYSGEGKVEKNEGRSLAYLLILYSATKKKPSKKVQDWIKATQSKLNPAQTKEADGIISGFAARPTPLTLRAMAREAEAKKLAATAPPPAPAPTEPPAPAAPAETEAEAAQPD